MTLNDVQTAALSAWIKQGLNLSDIQKRLESDFGLRITYMDLRFLVDDLDLEIKASAPKFDTPKVEDMAAPPPHGKVSVTLDKVTRPDALVSGRVTFSDGVSAQWALDQMGRLSLNAKDPAYRPAEEDLRDFQTELSEAVRKAGLF